jgi:hypothetical protein
MTAEEKISSKPQVNSNVTNFDNRINLNYDPGHKDRNYGRWNTDKQKLLEYMRSNKSALEKNKFLMKNVSDLKVTTGLSRKFPQYARYMALPPQHVPNDAHTKATGPGYARNNAGKPFFS